MEAEAREILVTHSCEEKAPEWIWLGHGRTFQRQGVCLDGRGRDSRMARCTFRISSMILLDTNVISALILDRPPLAGRVVGSPAAASVWTTSITVFEIRFGLNSMPAGKRQAQRIAVFERILVDVIEQRFATFDSASAERAAELAADRRRRGRPGELRDTMITGIVLASHAKLATRNVKHFQDIASSVINPWNA